MIPGSGRSPGEGNGNPLQYSCLENPMDRGAWGATVHGVAKIPSRRKEQPTPVFLPGKSHSLRSLMKSQRVRHSGVSNTFTFVKLVKSLSCVRLFETPWTVAPQAPLSMGFSRQEYWSSLPFSTPNTESSQHRDQTLPSD